MRPGTCGQQRCSHSNGSQRKGTLVQHLLTHNILTHRCRVIRLIFYFLYQFVFWMHATNSVQRSGARAFGGCGRERAGSSVARNRTDRRVREHWRNTRRLLLMTYDSTFVFCSFPWDECNKSCQNLSKFNARKRERLHELNYCRRQKLFFWEWRSKASGDTLRK